MCGATFAVLLHNQKIEIFFWIEFIFLVFFGRLYFGVVVVVHSVAFVWCQNGCVNVAVIVSW